MENVPLMNSADRENSRLFGRTFPPNIRKSIEPTKKKKERTAKVAVAVVPEEIAVPARFSETETSRSQLSPAQ